MIDNVTFETRFAVLKRVPVRRLALLFVLGRLVAFGCMYAGVSWPAPHLRSGSFDASSQRYFLQTPTIALDVFNRWDSQFYNSLATEGYPPAQVDSGWVYHAAYYPMFPVLMRGLSELTRLPTFLTGMLLSQLAWLLGVAYFWRLVRLDASERFAEQATACLLAYPGSHFLGTVYPDALALFLGVFATYCARHRLAFVASAALAFASVTRSAGPLLVFPVAFSLWHSVGSRWSFRLLWLLLPAVPVTLWLVLNHSLYGDPLYFMHVQAGWGRHAANPVLALFQVRDTVDYNLFAVASLGIVIYGVARRNALGEKLFSFSAVLLPLLTGILRGVHRYTASNFPLFIYNAQLLEGHPRLYRCALVGGFLLMGLYAFQWGKGQLPN
jgi:hypothetical protein